MSDVTRILSAIDAGDPHAASQLLPLVYDELRKLAAAKMAKEKPGQTLDATGLVHEAYVRLLGARGASKGSEESLAGASGSQAFANRRHFFAAAAEAMRRILVENARRKQAEKRGGGGRRLVLSDADRLVIPDPDLLLTVDEVLERLAGADPASASVARLRLFAGLSIEETAAVLGVSRATAFRDWAYARALLTAALADEKNPQPS
jgi:RNA polymerase sigma factor (TIGR02999 family)